MKDTESRGIFSKLFGGKKSACCDLTSETAAPASIANEAKGADGLVSATFQIVGLGCACEGQIVEKRVKALSGVKTFSLNPITNQMKLTYDPAALSAQDIQTAVKRAGATAVPAGSRADADQARSQPARRTAAAQPERGGGCC